MNGESARTPLEEFFDNSVAEFRRRGSELATWASARLVNRRDAWGVYRPAAKRKGPEDTAFTRKGKLGEAHLGLHFSCDHSRGGLVGLHSTAPDNTCRWFAIDIDAHEGEGADPDANFDAARHWHDTLSRAGFRPLLFDSNGRGGIHLLVVLSEPAESSLVYAFAQRLIRDWKSLRLKRAPETYPKQARLKSGEIGNWLRLPGLHHTYDHVSRAWNGEDWLDAAGTIEIILSRTGDDPALIQVSPATVGGVTSRSGDCGRAGHATAKCLKAMRRIRPRAGERDGSKRLFAYACRCVEHDLDETEAVRLIRECARLRPFPADYCDDEIRKRIRDAEAKCTRGSAVSDNDDDNPPRKSQATQIVELATDIELWHTPDAEPWATININGHQEHYALKSKWIRRFLQRRFFETFGRAVGSQALQDALGVLEGKALFDGKEYLCHVRTAAFNGAYFVDLCDSDWRVVEITVAGWRLTPNPPVRFRRRKGMLPLPVPVTGGSVSELRPLINLKDDDDWILVLSWLMAAVRERGPFPVLVITGEQGSAKSTCAKLLRLLIDPNVAMLRSEPRDKQDLMIAANNGWVIAFDNVSGLKVWLSDCLCRLSTGGGFSTRELYSNDEEVLFDAQRPIILNGIDDFVTRGDLVDRSVSIHLPAITKDKRQTEARLMAHFHRVHARILGAILTAASTAMRRLDSVQLEPPRMADWAIWVTAAEPGLGLADGSFMRAFDQCQGQATEAVLDSSPIWGPLQTVLDARNGVFEGTGTELLKALNAIAGNLSSGPNWPRNATALKSILRRLAPNLRQMGMSLTAWRAGKKRSRMVRLERFYAVMPTPPGDGPDGPGAPSREADAPDQRADSASEAESSAPIGPFYAENAETDGADRADAEIPTCSKRNQDLSGAEESAIPANEELFDAAEGYKRWRT